MVNELESDKLQIREVVENWVVWRDSADWERFATVWHSDGWMTATWFQGPASEFIEVSRHGFEAGVNILHQLGGSLARSPADGPGPDQDDHPPAGVARGLPADVVCWGRFYDFFEKRDERWASSGASRSTRRTASTRWIRSAGCSMPALLAIFPEGYCHLAYLQTKAGFTVKQGLPGLRGEAVQKLYARGRRLAERGASTRRAAVTRRLIAWRVVGSIEDSTNRTEEE